MKNIAKKIILISAIFFFSSCSCATSKSSSSNSSESSFPSESSSSQIKEKSILNVSLNTDSINRYILNNGKIDFTSAYIVISYSDGSFERVEIPESELPEFDYSSGPHEVEIILKSNNNYSFSFLYYVFDNEEQLNFVKSVNSLPYVNDLTTADVELINQLNTQKESLSGENTAFINSYYPEAFERLEKSENELVDVCFNEKVDELTTSFRSLNGGSYSPENLALIKSYINGFANASFNSLKDVLSSYNTVIENIAKVEKISVPIEEYKEKTISSLVSTLQTNRISLNKIDVSYSISRDTFDYSEDDSLKVLVNDAKNAILGASTPEEVDSEYSRNYEILESSYLNVFKEDALEDINALFEDTKAIESALLDEWGKNYISIDGLFNNISTNYKDDNRWWIPEPYKMITILNNAEKELSNESTIDGINKKYEALMFEIARTTLQKDLEMYYAIYRNINPAYDVGDTYYWNIIADYWGDTPARQFTYVGPLSDYYSNIYGNTSATCYRLISFFFNEQTRVQTIEQLFAKYFEFRNHIAPAPLAISKIEVFAKPTISEYALGEEIDLTGGTIRVTYNDTKYQDIPMTNSMLPEKLYADAIGSKEISIDFNDPRLGSSQNIKFNVVVLSENKKFNEIIAKVQSLPQIGVEIKQENLSAIKEIVDLENALTEQELTLFESLFQSETQTINNYQAKCASLYAGQVSKEIINKFEQLNINVLTESDKASVSSLFNDFVSGVYSLSTFNEIDASISSFEQTLNTFVPDSTLDLATYKAKTIQSLDDVLSFSAYKFSGEKNEVTVKAQKVSISENEAIKSDYDSFVELINSQTTIEDIESIFKANISSIYEKALPIISDTSLAAIRQSMYDIRSTISMIWAENGTDIITMKGEAANSELTTNYLDDGGYYCWYIPAEFQTGFVYNNMFIQDSSSKFAINASYDKGMYEICRSTFGRNLLHAWLFAKNSGYDYTGNWWKVMYTSPGFTYDGIFSTYFGKQYPNNTFRLWCWGYNQETKSPSIEYMLDRYNNDIGLFLIKD